LTVIDASALLAVLLGEKGSDAVVPVLRGSRMSAVNVSECLSRAPERGGTAEGVWRAIRRFEIAVVPFGADEAGRAAALRPLTRHVGASLGDRAFLGLAGQLGAKALTADQRLGKLDIDIDIQLIR
jgi:ribonuclease VapC